MIGHLAAFVTYSAMAVAGGYAAGTLISPSIGWLAGLSGAVLFLTAALIHEMIARRMQTAAQAGRILSLASLTNRLRDEVRELRDIQRAATAIGPQDSDDMEIMAAEMKMLKTLVSQLSHRSQGGHAPAPPQPAPAAAPPPRQQAQARPRPAAPPPPDDVFALEQPYAEPAPAGRQARQEPPPLFEVQDQAVPAASGYYDDGDLDLNDDAILLEVLRDALDEDRVDLYTQPIVSLPQRRLQFFDCVPLVRARDGRTILPSRYMPVAERAGLLAAVDNMLLFRAVQTVRRLRRRQQPISFFCSISRPTLNDKSFFSDFIGFMRQNTDLASHLIFSVSQFDYYRVEASVNAEIANLSKLGFRYCLDQVSNLDLFVSDLSDRGFRYVKVDAMTLMARLDRAGDPRALKRALDRGAMDLIVTGIDTDPRLLEMLDYAVDFGQGSLFGEPRPALDR